MNSCDRCGVPAKFRFVLASGSDLVFCGHHSREYEDRLIDECIDIVDLEETYSQLVGA